VGVGRLAFARAPTTPGDGFGRVGDDGSRLALVSLPVPRSPPLAAAADRVRSFADDPDERGTGRGGCFGWSSGALNGSRGYDTPAGPKCAADGEKARTARVIRETPASSSASAHARRVAPVVRTSSTKRAWVSMRSFLERLARNA
jgi:hypothetical protein